MDPLKPRHSRTYAWNAFETGLKGPVGDGDNTIALDSTLNLRAPGYLVIDPEDSAKREFIYYENIIGETLHFVERLQNGSAGVTKHDSGTKVRSVAMEQMWDDLWNAVELEHAASEKGLKDHIGDTVDPHVAAGYMTRTASDKLYVRLDGTKRMTGPLVLSSTALPSADAAAVPKAAMVAADTKLRTDFEKADAALDAKIKVVDGKVPTWASLVGKPSTFTPSNHSTTKITSGTMAADRLPKPSASAYGVVRLSDNTASTSGVTGGYAATPKAVKAAMDKAKAAETAAKHSHPYLHLTSTKSQTVKGPLTLSGEVRFDKQVYFQKGSNSNPQLRFFPDKPNTGIYADDPGEVSFTMEGNRRFTVWTDARANSRSNGATVEIRSGSAANYVLSGDGKGTTFRLTAKALRWLMKYN